MRVLIIAEDDSFVARLSSAIRAGLGGGEVVHVDNGMRALEELANALFEFVVISTAIDEPINPAALFLHCFERAQDAHAFIVLPDGDGFVWEAPSAAYHGASRESDPGEIVKAMKEITRRKRLGAGHLRALTLQDSLWVFAACGTSATLRLRSMTTTGDLHFRHGQVVHATRGNDRGIDALIEWIVEGGATVLYDQPDTGVDRTIKLYHADLMSHVIKEAQRSGPQRSAPIKRAVISADADDSIISGFLSEAETTGAPELVLIEEEYDEDAPIEAPAIVSTIPFTRHGPPRTTPPRRPTGTPADIVQRVWMQLKGSRFVAAWHEPTGDLVAHYPPEADGDAALTVKHLRSLLGNAMRFGGETSDFRELQSIGSGMQITSFSLPERNVAILAVQNGRQEASVVRTVLRERLRDIDDVLAEAR